MSLPSIILDTDKTTPIYELPLKIRQGDTGDELQVTLGKSFQKYTDLSAVDVELIAKTPDQRLIKQPVTDKSGNTFKVKFPDEMYTNVGVFRNMYFKIGDDSTSSVKLVVLQGIGSIKEAGSYIDDFETLIKEAESYVLALKDFSDTGNAKIDDKVAELTGKMTDFVDKSKEDLDAAKEAWSTFQSSSQTAASDQRDGFDTTFNKLISDDKATFKTISDEFNTTVDTAKSQNTANQTVFESAESKRENDFTSQSADFEKRYVAQGSDFEDRFKKFIPSLQSDYDEFKKILTTDVADLNTELDKIGADTKALQAKADSIADKLKDVDLSQMQTNKTNIEKLRTDLTATDGKFKDYKTSDELNTLLKTYVLATQLSDTLASFSKSDDVKNWIATSTNQTKQYAAESIKAIIGAAPATLDTIGELADAVTKNKDGVQAINDGITKKADKTDVTALQNTVQTMITSISQADYDKLVSAGTVDPKILYVIPDA